MKTGQCSKSVFQALAELASTRPKLKAYLEALPREAYPSLTLRQVEDGYLLSYLMKVPAPSPGQAGGWAHKTVSYAFR